MSEDWPTKDKDMTIAQDIIEKYTADQHEGPLGLFELVVNIPKKRMDFRLSSWVLALAGHFKSLYGPHQGDFVTRQVISHCIIKNHTLH